MYCLFSFCLGICLGSNFNYFSEIVQPNLKKNKVINTNQDYCDWETPDINKCKEVKIPINIQPKTEKKTKNNYWFY